MDTLHLLYWNVQGMGAQAFRRFKELLRLDLGTIDILFLQEHHLCMDRIQKNGSILPGRWTNFWITTFGPTGCQARLCTTIKQHFQSIIVSVATIINKQAQFLIVKIGS